MEHLAARGCTARSRCASAPAKRSGALAGTPGGDRHLPRRIVGCAGRRVRIAREVGEALARMHLAGADFALSAAPTRCRLDALAAAVRGRARARPTRSRRAWQEIATSSSACERDLAGRPAGRRHPRRSVPRQRLLPRRQAVGPDRLLFRLQRLPRLRSRHLPQRLVLRAGWRVQRLQGHGDDRGLSKGPAR